MGQVSFDCVVNMACNYGRRGELLSEIVQANMGFPLEVLDKAAERKVRRFLTIGTGLPKQLNMYSLTKGMFGEAGRFYAEHREIAFYNMKLEMFYGSDEPRDRFLPWLVESMIKGKDVDVTSGTQHRDLIAVEDVVDSVIKVVHSAFFGQKTDSGYFEIPVGTGIAPAVSEVVDYIWDQTGRKSRIHRGAAAMRNNEPDCIADRKILSGIVEWNPVFWKDGIAKMIEEMKCADCKEDSRKQI